MKISELIKKYGWSTFSNSDGCCACGNASFGGINIETHCHKSGGCGKHPYSCVHVWPDEDFWLGSENKNKEELKKIANLIAREIRKGYLTECAIGFKEVK
jgi:hypothetical protein